MIVLDTNIVSELMRPEPDPTVVRWLEATDGSGLRTTAVTIAELRYGLARLPDGRRRAMLEETFDAVVADFEDSCLDFDAGAARHYGRLAADRERTGRPADALDAQIAAICLTQGASLATRNTPDFEDSGLELIDPFRN